jgi:hypothetical protein
MTTAGAQGSSVTEMIRWSVMQVMGKDGTRTRHLVGRLNGHGRISTPIAQFDLDTLCAMTQPGRIYRLTGPPIPDPDARYVFTSWVRASGAAHSKDVTRALMHLREKRGLIHLNPW